MLEDDVRYVKRIESESFISDVMDKVDSLAFARAEEEQRLMVRLMDTYNQVRSDILSIPIYIRYLFRVGL